MMKTSKSILFGLSILLSLLLMSDQATAQWGKGTKGSGKIVSQDREVKDFSEIRLNCSADIYITQGSKAHIVVETDDNLLDKVETDVSGNVLTIDIDGNIWRSHQMKVYVTLTSLHKISVNGSGDVQSKNTIKGIDLDVGINGSGDIDLELEYKNVNASINGSGDMELSGVSGDFSLKVSGSGGFDGNNMRLNVCDISIYGSGDVELSGSANKVKVEQSASGEVNLYKLAAQDVSIRSSGSGDMVVSVSGELQARLHGSGDLTYKGEPLSVDVSSNGSGDVYHR